MKTMSVFRTYSGFWDLNIDSTHDFVETCDRLIELNYRVIALNQTVNTKKKKESSEIEVPPPLKIPVPEHVRKKLQILNRLTIPTSDPAHLQRLAQNENFKKYNLIALIPETEAVFKHACTLKLVDIISFNVDKTNVLFTLNHKLYSLAVDQNIYFELSYAPIIEGTKNIQQNIIRTAHKYRTIGKSKNIIVTSAARNTDDIIGPYNVIGLGLMFHLSEEQVKSAITRNCENLLLHAEARRFRRAGVATTVNEMDVDSASEEENDTVNLSKTKNVKLSANKDESCTDDVPNSKRHHPDPQMKPFLINKDIKT